MKFSHAALMHPNDLSVRTAHPIFAINGRCFGAENQMTVIVMDDAIKSGGTCRRRPRIAENLAPGAKPFDMVGMQIPVIGQIARCRQELG